MKEEEERIRDINEGGERERIEEKGRRGQIHEPQNVSLCCNIFCPSQRTVPKSVEI